MSPFGRRAFVVLLILYAAITIPLAVHKGEDVASEIAQTTRLLNGLPVYDHPQNQGVWWPPFALFALTPFALLAMESLALAKGAWAAFGIACLGWSLWRTSRWGGRPMVLAVLAVALPIQDNFQHLNIDAPLLALAIAAAEALRVGQEGRAGAWTAVATAIKVFPGLLVPYFALRRRWHACTLAIIGTAALTYGAMLPYGPGGAAEAVGRWLALNAHATSFQGAAVTGLHMQKLSRLVYALDGGVVALIVAHVALIALALVALHRQRGSQDTLRDVGIVLIVGCLISPIGWLHTFTLAYPLWVATLAAPSEGTNRLRTAGLVVAGILTSGYLSKIPWPSMLAFVPAHNDTIGSLLLLAIVASRPQQASDPAAVPMPVPAVA